MSPESTRFAGSTETVRVLTVPTGTPMPAVTVVRAVPRWLVACGFGAVVATLVLLTTALTFVPDSYLALYAGRFVAQTGVPVADPFTAVAHGREWIDEQWLGQWLYYRAWLAGGNAAVGALSAALIAVSFGLLTSTILRRGISPTRAVIWSTVALFVCLLNLVIRTQSFAYPCYAAMLWILLEDARRERYNWRVFLGLPVLIVWANVHGSALMGAAIATAWLVYRAVRSRRADPASSDRYLATAFVFAASVMIISPYSPRGLIHYYTSVLQNPELTRYVPEWQPATFGGASIEFVILLGLVLVTVAYAFGKGLRPSWPLLVLVAVTAAGGIHAVRLQAWFAFPAVILMADVMEQLAPGRRQGALLSGRRTQLLGVASAGLLVVSGALALLQPAGALKYEFVGVVIGFLGIVLAASAGGYASRWLRPVLIGAGCVPLLCATVALAGTHSRQFEAMVPHRALDVATAYAQAHPGTRILADDITSPALLWLAPQLDGRIGFDPRYELYSRRQLMPFLHYVSMDTPTWAAVTRNYQVLVVSRDKNPAAGPGRRRVARLAGDPLRPPQRGGRPHLTAQMQQTCQARLLH